MFADDGTLFNSKTLAAKAKADRELAAARAAVEEKYQALTANRHLVAFSAKYWRGVDSALMSEDSKLNHALNAMNGSALPPGVGFQM